jgi:hypothetical protein
MSPLYFGGIPTGPAVAEIIKKIGDVLPGTDISYSAIEAAIGAKRNSSRFRTVTAAWRKECLRRRNVEVVAVAKTGFRALLPEERVGHNYQGFRAGLRKQSRAVKRVTMVRDDELTPDSRTRRENMQRSAALIMDIATNLHKSIAPPAPQQQLPKPK